MKWNENISHINLGPLKANHQRDFTWELQYDTQTKTWRYTYHYRNAIHSKFTDYSLRKKTQEEPREKKSHNIGGLEFASILCHSIYCNGDWPDPLTSLTHFLTAVCSGVFDDDKTSGDCFVSCWWAQKKIGQTPRFLHWVEGLFSII